MDLPRRLFAPVCPAFAPQYDRVRKSATAGGGAGLDTPPAVLTYPVRDRQGDVLEPGGLDLWEFEHVYERLSNFEHGPYVGTTAVEFKSMPRLDAAGKPDESLGLVALPVGVTTFFGSLADARNHTLRKFDHDGRVVGTYTAAECWQLADHLRPLVPAVYGGVSLEFRPDGPEGVAYKSLGPHPLLPGRPALHFFKSKMLGLASACEVPVNPFAGYPRATPELIDKAEKALKYCERGDSLAVIRKSLSPLTALLETPPSGRVSAPVRRDPTMTKTAPRVTKADPYADDRPPDEPAADAVTAEPAGDEVTATAAAAFQAAQGLLDLAAMVRDQVARGEHVKGKKKLLALCDGLEKDAADAKAIGDMVTADVGGEAEAEMPDEPPPPETDEEGAIKEKSFGGWRPRRFVKATPYTLKHLAGAKAAPAGGEAERLLDWALTRIEELEAEQKRAN